MKAFLIKEPVFCPYCHSSLIHQINNNDNLSVNLYCTNKFCKEIIIAKLIYFASKECLNLKGLSEKTIYKLYDLHIVNKWQDFYTKLNKEILLNNNFGIKTTENIINEVNKSLSIPPFKILKALSIPSIGEEISIKIMEYVKSYENLINIINSSSNELLNIDIGEVSLSNLDKYIHENLQEFEDIINIFKQNTNIIDKEESSNIESNILQGKNILATGTLSNFNREEIKNSIILNGGHYATSINKSISFILVGENPGMSKINKAKEFNIKIITEEDYLKLINKIK